MHPSTALVNDDALWANPWLPERILHYNALAPAVSLRTEALRTQFVISSFPDFFQPELLAVFDRAARIC